MLCEVALRAAQQTAAQAAAGSSNAGTAACQDVAGRAAADAFAAAAEAEEEAEATAASMPAAAGSSAAAGPMGGYAIWLELGKLCGYATVRDADQMAVAARQAAAAAAAAARAVLGLYQALVKSRPNKPAVQLLLERLALGMQHTLRMGLVEPAVNDGTDRHKCTAQLIRQRPCDHMFQELVPVTEQQQMASKIRGCDTVVRCEYTGGVLVTVIGKQLVPGQLAYEACLWLLVLLWLEVPDAIKADKRTAAAWQELRVALGQQQGSS